MFESSDNTMFLAILRNPDHVLHFLLPPPKTTGHDLRKRCHGLTLTATQSSLVRKNFILCSGEEQSHKSPTPGGAVVLMSTVGLSIYSHLS